MTTGRSARPPAQLVALIAAITVVPLITLLWLGWRLLEQDYLLERQQIRQRVERGADLIVAALQRAIVSDEQRLAGNTMPVPTGAVTVVFRDGSVDVSPRGGVAYLPGVARLGEPLAAAFVRGDELEFRRQDQTGAIQAFRELTRSADSSIRTGAWLRLARSLQKAGRPDEALDAYARVADVDDVAVQGVPAGLVARYARCRLLEKQGRLADLRAEAATLETALHAGRWRLTAAVYSLYSVDAARWSGGDPARWRDAEAAAEAVAAVWTRWQTAPATAASSRESIDVDGRSFVIVAQRANGVLRALVASPVFVESQWLAPLSSVAAQTHTVFALRDAAGKSVSGAMEANRSDAIARSSSETALPWTVVAASVQPPPEERDFAVRRRLLAAGFILLVLMALLASYLIVRAVSREAGRRAAAVGFRLGGLARIPDAAHVPAAVHRNAPGEPRLDGERRQVAYDAQVARDRRLTRLVESLLDFGRMQAGAHRYQFEPRDCTELVRAVVDDFAASRPPPGTSSPSAATDAAPIDIDDEALSRAVRNLLDNAVKYSPDPHRSRSTSVARTAPWRSPSRSRHRHSRRRAERRSSRSSTAASRPARAASRAPASVWRWSTRSCARTGPRRSRQRAGRRQHVHHRAAGEAPNAMARILIVEDEPDIALGLQLDLRDEGLRRRGRRATATMGAAAPGSRAGSDPARRDAAA